MVVLIACGSPVPAPQARGEDRTAPPPTNERELAFGSHRACTRTSSGGVACWTIGDQAGASFAERVPGLDHVRSVAMSGNTLLATRDHGELWRWDGSPPVAIAQAIKAVDVAGGIACTIDRQGKVECWGEAGQEIVGSPPNAPAFVDVRVGPPAACGMTSAGDIWCWEWRWKYLDQWLPSEPTRVPLVHPATTLAVADGRTCAGTDGGVECWGSPMTNDPASEGCRGYAELHNNPYPSTRWRDCPVHRLAGLSDVTALTIAGREVIATTHGGSVVAWLDGRVTPLLGATGLRGIAARTVATGLEVCGRSTANLLACVLDPPPPPPPPTPPGSWSVRIP